MTKMPVYSFSCACRHEFVSLYFLSSSNYCSLNGGIFFGMQALPVSPTERQRIFNEIKARNDGSNIFRSYAANKSNPNLVLITHTLIRNGVSFTEHFHVRQGSGADAEDAGRYNINNHLELHKAFSAYNPDYISGMAFDQKRGNPNFVLSLDDTMKLGKDLASASWSPGSLNLHQNKHKNETNWSDLSDSVNDGINELTLAILNNPSVFNPPRLANFVATTNERKKMQKGNDVEKYGCLPADLFHAVNIVKMIKSLENKVLVTPQQGEYYKEFSRIQTLLGNSEEYKQNAGLSLIMPVGLVNKDAGGKSVVVGIHIAHLRKGVAWLQKVMPATAFMIDPKKSGPQNRQQRERGSVAGLVIKP